MITYKRKKFREAPHASNANNQGEHQETEHREIADMGFRLLELPSSIIFEVLTRMPAKEVSQCRCTCKTLYRLTSDPSFAKSLLVRSPLYNLVYHSVSHNGIQFIRLLRYDNLDSSFKNLNIVSKRQIPRPDKLEIVGSSNGLLCLWDKSSLAKTLYLTNPLLGETAVLPKPLSDKSIALDEAYWFGYIPKMNIYKVIRVKVRRALLQSNPRKFYWKSEVHVLVIGTDMWTYVGDAPFPLFGKFSISILNGFLHWMANDLDTLELIAFNVEKDQLHTLPTPPRLESRCFDAEVGVLRNKLCLSGCSPSFEYVEIWTMQEYGVASSWIRHHFFKPSFSSVTFLKDGQRIFLWPFRLLLSYDPEEKKYTGSLNLARKRRHATWIYTPSFLSLTHLSSGACLRVKNAKSYIT